MHAFSPSEVTHGARRAGEIRQGIFEGTERPPGWAPCRAPRPRTSRPGPAASLPGEDLREGVARGDGGRARSGVRATATIMFGGAEGYGDWARHLRAVRALQLRRSERRRGSSRVSFFCVERGRFVGGAPLARRGFYLWGSSRSLSPCPSCPTGPPEQPRACCERDRRGGRPFCSTPSPASFSAAPIANIQASWPKLGVEAVPFLLNAGCNDAGGVLMRESITRAAGGEHGQGVDAAGRGGTGVEGKRRSFSTRNSTSSTREWRGDGGGGSGSRCRGRRCTGGQAPRGWRRRTGLRRRGEGGGKEEERRRRGRRRGSSGGRRRAACRLREKFTFFLLSLLISSLSSSFLLRLL